MPLYKEDNFLIIYPSSRFTVFSFGLSDSLSPPQFKIPSVVYRNTTTNEFQSTSNDQTTEIYPIVQNKIVNLDAFNHLLKIILQSIINDHPTVTINQIPMLLIIPSLTWSRNSLEYITKYVIESLEITAFNIVDLSLAATFGAGQLTSSTVVYVDHENIQVVPVVGYQAIKFAGKIVNNEGGITINRELKKLFPNLSESQLEDLKESGIYEVLIDQNEQSGLDEIQEFDVAKILTDENGQNIGDVEKQEVDSTKANRDLERNFFIDSQTKEKVWVGKERFSGTASLVKLIAKSIYSALLQIPDIDRRQDCYDNIILVGSVFKIPGLKEAVLLKLTQDYLVTEPSSDDQKLEDQSGVNAAIMKYQQADEIGDGDNQQSNTSQVPNSIKLAKFADYFPEWKKPKEFGGSWQDVYFLGGQIYSKQIFSGSSHHHGKELFVGSDMYEERGPQSIWDASI